MKNTMPYQTVCSVYPGKYVPLLNEKLTAGLKHMPESDTIFLYTNTIELTNAFKFEIAIPGVERDGFRIHTDNNILSICVLHKKTGKPGLQHVPAPEYNYECFDRDIVLPDNVDPDFISAEYKAGILCIHVPKTKQPVKNLYNEIVIY
jgi:HSP20 family protein